MKRMFFLMILPIFILINCFAGEYSNFLGNWVIEEKIELQGTISSSEYYDLKNINISFSSNKIIFDGNEISIKKISEDIYTSEILFNETRGSGSKGITFADLGIKSNTINVIVIKLAQSPKMSYMTLLDYDKDKLIMEVGGNYYILNKKD